MRETIVVFKCDMPECPTPEERVQTRYISKDFTADLCDTHGKALDEARAPFMAVAQKVKVTDSNTVIRRGSTAKRGTGGTKADQEQQRKNYRNAVSYWMADNGYTLPSMGRIPNDVKTAFEAKNPEMIPDKYKAPALIPAPQPEPEKPKLTVVPSFTTPDYETADKPDPAPTKPAPAKKAPAKKATTTRKPPASTGTATK